MGKSILVSHYPIISQCKKLQVYTNRNVQFDSCHMHPLSETKNISLMVFFRNIYYFPFSNFSDSSDSTAPTYMALCFIRVLQKITSTTSVWAPKATASNAPSSLTLRETDGRKAIALLGPKIVSLFIWHRYIHALQYVEQFYGSCITLGNHANANHNWILDPTLALPRHGSANSEKNYLSRPAAQLSTCTHSCIRLGVNREVTCTRHGPGPELNNIT